MVKAPKKPSGAKRLLSDFVREDGKDDKKLLKRVLNKDLGRSAPKREKGK